MSWLCVVLVGRDGWLIVNDLYCGTEQQLHVYVCVYSQY